MTLAETILAMVEAGCSVEQIAKIAAQHKAREDVEADARRKSDRERQARHRAKKAADVTPCHAMSRDVTAVTRDRAKSEHFPQVVENIDCVTQNSVTGTDDATRAPVFPVGDTNVSPLLTPLPKGRPPSSKTTGSAIPEDWTPSDELFAYAGGLGLSRSQAEASLEDMRLWALANRNRAVARKANWDLTAKGWLRRDAQKFRQPARDGPIALRPQQRGGAAYLLMNALEEQRRERQKDNSSQAIELLPLLRAER